MILLPMLLEAVDKKTLLHMQEIVIDIDPEADAELSRGVETRASVRHKYVDVPWVVEVTFSNGVYRVYRPDGFDEAAFKKLVARSAPASYKGRCASLMNQLKCEFGEDAVIGDVGSSKALVYASAAERTKRDQSYSQAVKQVNRHKYAIGRRLSSSDTFKLIDEAYEKLTKGFPPVISVKIIPKTSVMAKPYSIKVAINPISHFFISNEEHVSFETSNDAAIAKIRELQS